MAENTRNELVADTNPTGSVASSQLELAKTIAYPDIIATHCDVTEKTATTLHDTDGVLTQKRLGKDNRSSSLSPACSHPQCTLIRTFLP
jgi:hypothetical protein